MVSPTVTQAYDAPVRAPFRAVPGTPSPARARAVSGRPGSSLRRTKVAVTVVAASTALWLGLTAPSVSPVTPTAPPATVGITTGVGGSAPDPVAVVPAVPVPAAGGRGGRGPGGGGR